MGMGMLLWEWEGMGTEIVLPAHLYAEQTDRRTDGRAGPVLRPARTAAQ